MTQEQKDKLEQAYEFHAKEGTVIREADSLSAFLIGAQEVLSNPEKYDLVPIEYYRTMLKEEDKVNQRLREALERITNGNLTENQAWKIAKEALKQ